MKTRTIVSDTDKSGAEKCWHPGLPQAYRNMVVEGDMRALIECVPNDAVDLVLTDPPYNIGFKYDVYEDSLLDHEYVEMLSLLRRFPKVVLIQYPEQTMRLITPALGVPAHVGAWCVNSNIPRRLRLITYYGGKPDYRRLRQPYKNPNDRRVRALIENGSEGGPLYEWWADIPLVKNTSRERGAHPCPVPIRLMERIILLTTEPGDVILDPFAGGGTTAVAAKLTGRKFVGFEISPAYVQAANERIAATPQPIFPPDARQAQAFKRNEHVDQGEGEKDYEKSAIGAA